MVLVSINLEPAALFLGAVPVVQGAVELDGRTNQPAPTFRPGILLPGRCSGGDWKVVKRSPRRPVTITVTPEELVQRYLDGASLDDLGVLCGCSGKRIRRILVAQGVEIRPRGYNSDCRSTKFVRR